jgi:hypothetical protein
MKRARKKEVPSGILAKAVAVVGTLKRLTTNETPKLGG